MAATISALPPVPLLTDTPEVFDPKAVTFNLALNPFREQANTLAAEAEADALAAKGGAQNSAQFANNSANSAQEAQQFANGDLAEGSAKNWATRTTEIVDGLKGARGYAQDASSSASSAATDATRAESAVATLPEGTIADAIIAPDKAWSSQKINSLLTLDDQLSFKSDFVRDEYFVDAGSRTFAPAEYVWDVVRASPTYALGANGKYREVPANTIARDWNPETGQYEAQVSGAVTNILTNTNDSSEWLLVNGAVIEAVEVNGGVERVTVRLPAGNTAGIELPYGAELAGTYTASARVRFLEGAGTDLLDITMINSTGWFSQFANPPLDGSWGFIERTEDINGDGGVNLIRRASASGGDIVVQVEAQQMEAGSVRNAYVPTLSSPVTRAADEISRELGAEFDASEGTIIVEFDGVTLQDGSVTAQVAGILDSGDINNRILVEVLPQVRLRRNGTFTSPEPSLGTLYSGGTGIAAFSWDVGGVIVAFNGESKYADGAVDLNPIAGFSLSPGGSDSASLVNRSNSGIVRLSYIPRALTATQLQELTTP